MVSRIARSFASGFLAVVIGLYYLNALHLSELLIGVLFGTGAIVTPIMSFLLGRYADIHGRKKALLITLACLPVAIAILIFTTYFPLLIISAALGGFGIAGGLVGAGVGAMAIPMQMALLAEKTNPLNRTRVFSIFQMLSALAGSTGALLSHISDYTELFYIALIITIVSLVVALPIRESFRHETNSPRKSGLSPEDKSIVKKFTVTGAFNGTAQGLYIPFLAIIFSTYFHASNGEIGNVFALGGLLSAGSTVLTPYLTGRLGFVRFIVVTRAISAIAAVLIPFSLNFVLGSIFYLISTPARGMSLPTQSSFLMSLVSEGSRATATGSNQMARLAPAALATAASGYFLDTLPISVPFLSSFLFNVSNLFLYRRFFGKASMSRSDEAQREQQ